LGAELGGRKQEKVDEASSILHRNIESLPLLKIGETGMEA